MPDCYESL